MTIHVKTGGFTVIESTTFLAYGLGETEVCLGDLGPEQLRFLLNFKIDNEKKDPAFGLEPIDDHAVRIQLTNWNNSLGMTLTAPQKIGSYKGRELLLAFAVAKIGDKAETRQITLTFYGGEVVKNG